ncbi:MAG TPA: Hsp20/alpha crystallin family protein [Chthonomonadales bacterium]|nr:Hsp20/alpha crystallin family protein [Chthonomonadales bacterium]
MRSYDPFTQLEQMHRELSRALGLSEGSAPGRRQMSFLPGRSARSYPLINLGEDRENVYVQALAPGIDPDSLNLTVHGNALTISGEKPGPADVPREAFHRSERAAGRFVRTVDLPNDVEADGATAQYAHGLLTITLPKPAAAKPRQIQVSVS